MNRMSLPLRATYFEVGGNIAGEYLLEGGDLKSVEKL